MRLVKNHLTTSQHDWLLPRSSNELFHGYSRFALWTVLAIASLAFNALAIGAETTRRPNVVVFLADDQGWGDLSLHGNPNLATPNIDSLARDGAELKHFYVCAVCSPTRAEFLTGRYHTRMGVFSTSAGGERFNADEQTIGEVFRDAGYSTAAFGKWHSGMQWPYHPNARGFDEYFGFCSGHWGHYFSPMLEHNGAIVQGKGFIVDDLTNHAIEFISSHQNDPFFVYLPLNTPHSPMQVPDPYWERHKDQEIVSDPDPENQKRQDLVHTRAALAMCENIDDNVGRVLKHLDNLDLSADTIVLYFSDNGPNGSRFNGGMRGRKGSTHEGGLRSPCLIRYPRKISPGTNVDRIAAAIDLLPTLAEFAGIGLHSPKPLDGISLVRSLMDHSSPHPERFLFSAWKTKASVRSDQYRMQLDGTLYDLERDPGEKVDVANQYPQIASKMSAALKDWIEETKGTASPKDKNRPFPVGHPKAKWTQLPSRDAIASGKIRRSNRFPNCTFMTNWVNTKDEITWDVNVLAPGTFEVEMYYSCPKSSVGTQLELRCGEGVVATEIKEANDVPLVGAEEDRKQRQEGYVRRWKPMRLGQITLVSGRQTMSLRATEMKGQQVADMRLLMFRRLD